MLVKIKKLYFKNIFKKIEIDDETLIKFCDYIKNNNTVLKNIDLSKNRLTDRGAIYLID